ncbi:MAG: hypothetical protein AAF573_03715, partial [Bacteroidota bacterium]
SKSSDDYGRDILNAMRKYDTPNGFKRGITLNDMFADFNWKARTNKWVGSHTIGGVYDLYLTIKGHPVRITITGNWQDRELTSKSFQSKNQMSPADYPHATQIRTWNATYNGAPVLQVRFQDSLINS